jgi:hypothetical protein
MEPRHVAAERIPPPESAKPIVSNVVFRGLGGPIGPAALPTVRHTTGSRCSTSRLALIASSSFASCCAEIILKSQIFEKREDVNEFDGRCRRLQSSVATDSATSAKNLWGAAVKNEDQIYAQSSTKNFQLGNVASLYRGELISVASIPSVCQDNQSLSS